MAMGMQAKQLTTTMTMTMTTETINAPTPLALMRLLQLTSSNLPVGGYTFSQGLEYAIEANWLKSPEDVQTWIEQVSLATLVYNDLPLITRLHSAYLAQNWDQFDHYNDLALAIRETKELLLADLAMGQALQRLAKSTAVPLPPNYQSLRARISFVSMYSVMASHMNISLSNASTGYCWTLLENQVLAATKLLPMGQTAAQIMLTSLSERLHDSFTQSQQVNDDQIGLSLPGLTMASAQHEQQYSRLYRS